VAWEGKEWLSVSWLLLLCMSIEYFMLDREKLRLVLLLGCSSDEKPL
jgi:hypothetical protein